MSYDLYLRPGGSRSLSATDFERYFTDRPHYTLEGNQAVYVNQDTGVYFCFDLEVTEDEENEEAGHWASFNLNFYRPHFFGLEAVLELEALVSALDLEIEDPQSCAKGAFVGSKFLSYWSYSNRASYRTARITDAEPDGLMATAEAESIWRWNFDRQRVQQRLGDWIFVPKILFLSGPKQPATVTIWADGIPVLLPETDMVIVPREQLAPRGLLNREGDLALATWEELEPLVTRFRRAEEPLPHYALDFQETPRDIETLLRGLATFEDEPTLLSPGSILNQEAFEEAREQPLPRAHKIGGPSSGAEI